MKKSILCMSLVMGVSGGLQAGELEQRSQSSRKVVKEFMGQLKGELQKAMKSGGPGKAIKVCNTKAPEIAGNISKKYDWRVARTSLKLRNPKNEYDAWELKVLQDFETRKARGEDVKKMEFAEIVKTNGKQTFRYMKAIPTGEVCLKCHGSKIKPDLEAQLKQLYPLDKARGYNKGDIRGAFTISQPM